MDTQFPLSTGAVVKLLQIPEYRLINLERQGKLTIPLICGRRAWNKPDVLKAAKLLGRNTHEVRNLCEATANTNGGDK